MFKHILFPTDLSENSLAALQIAIEIAAHMKAKISLLHVIETLYDTSYEEMKEFYTRLEKRAKKGIGGFVEHYKRSDVIIEQNIVYGDRTGEILHFASQNNVDLIIMNSHKIDPNDPIRGWGTISYKIGILSQCPVMLVK